ncbi:MAG: hypothetical protein HQL96_09210 [Magnetococcales bacterium]|nr:hypothetical protein [Magnetococcales bacterium]
MAVRIDKHDNGSPWWGAVFFAVLGMTAFLYWPGLNGPYLLDDLMHLPHLEQIHDAPSLDRFLAVINGIDPARFSRPLTMTTFAAQYQDWPHHPWMFKYVNLAIHLINGCLLCLVFMKLGRLRQDEPNLARKIALSASCIWLIHPLNISTTLYIIQRGTQFSTLFILLSILGYLHGRQLLLDAGRSRLNGYLWLSGSVALGGVLATLGKENGSLLTLFILVLEGTLLRRIPRPVGWRAWSGLFLLAPLLLLLALIGIDYKVHIETPTIDYKFTLTERILSNFVVLSDYLRQIALPSLARLGLMHDDYPVSHGVLDPVHTLPAMLLILGLIGSALLWRKNRPVWAFGVLWYFAGHTLESTVLPLHLYFEHRNYLPAMGLWYAAVNSFFRLWDKREAIRLRPFLTVCGAFYCLLLGFLTRSESTLWGNGEQLALIWSQNHPTSRWAQGQLATMLIMQRQPVAALEIYQKLLKANTADKTPYFDWLKLACHFPEIPLPAMGEMRQAFRSEIMYLPSIDLLLSEWNGGKCKQIDAAFLLELLALRPVDPARIPVHYFAVLDYYTALVHHKNGQLEQALTHIDAALRLSPYYFMVFKKTEWLMGAQRYAEALQILDRQYPEIKLSRLTRGYETEKIENWKKFIRQLILSTQANPGNQTPP